jgi:hypothetical protein
MVLGRGVLLLLVLDLIDMHGVELFNERWSLLSNYYVIFIFLIPIYGKYTTFGEQGDLAVCHSVPEVPKERAHDDEHSCNGCTDNSSIELFF